MKEIIILDNKEPQEAPKPNKKSVLLLGFKEKQVRSFLSIKDKLRKKIKDSKE